MGLSARLYILLAGFKCWMRNEVTGQQENDLSKQKLLNENIKRRFLNLNYSYRNHKHHATSFCFYLMVKAD